MDVFVIGKPDSNLEKFITEHLHVSFNLMKNQKGLRWLQLLKHLNCLSHYSYGTSLFFDFVTHLHRDEWNFLISFRSQP